MKVTDHQIVATVRPQPDDQRCVRAARNVAVCIIHSSNYILYGICFQVTENTVSISLSVIVLDFIAAFLTLDTHGWL